jgi:hypothetical protein
MGFFFWLFWVLDALLLVLSAVGGGFRRSFGASDTLNTWITLLMILVLIFVIIVI